MSAFDIIINEINSIKEEMDNLMVKNSSLKNRINELEKENNKNSIVGYIYILTNPTMPGLVKIGYADDVPARMKSLYNTSVAAPFECYAIYGIENRLLDKNLHSLIDGFDPDLRMTDNREYYRMEPERAYNILLSIAKINAREEHLILNPYEEKKEEKVEKIVEETNTINSIVNPIIERFEKKHLEDNKDKYQPSRKNNTYSYMDVPEGYYHNKKKDVYAYVDDKGNWTILEGSYGSMKTVSYYTLNDDLMNVRINKVKDNKFIEDVNIGKVKPSLSACYITLGTMDGWSYWYTENDITIHEAFPRKKKN